jgi:Holliday junction resolvase RusA-like endonuclease
MIKMSIPVSPVPAGRPRFTRNGHAYDPPKSRRFKHDVQLYVKRMYREQPIADVPISVTVNFYRPIQKSISKKEHTRREKHTSLPLCKPDIDNYIKSTFDALNGVLWTDDNLICHIESYKFYDVEPHIEIKVKEM